MNHEFYRLQLMLFQHELYYVVSECSILVRYLPLSPWIVFIMGIFCMNYLKHATLLSSKKLLGWIFEMSEFMVICFYMFILDKESHSQSLCQQYPQGQGQCVQYSYPSLYLKPYLFCFIYLGAKESYLQLFHSSRVGNHHCPFSLATLSS